MATENAPVPKGDERLIFDCAAVGRMVENDRPPASERLVTTLGQELASFLLHRADERAAPQEETA